jgi:hypothetical protein
MGWFDDIVPPDTASPGWHGLPRITVRPKGVEPPPAPENAAPARTGGLFDDIVPPTGLWRAPQTPVDASDETDNAAPARTGGLFDDIVPPAGLGRAPQTAVDASDETGNAPPARTGGLFDDIVPPAGVPASGMPESDGGQFAAPLPDGRNFRFAREGISPPARFVDRLAAMWENPPKDKPSLIGLIKSAYDGATLPGDVLSGKTSIIGPDGHTSDEVISRAKDLAQVYPLRGAPGGVFARPIKDRVANPLRTAEGVVRDEAVTRGMIAPAVPPASPRQIFEASEQGVSIPRAGPQPPTRPPDKAAAQSDRMTSEARESGPFDSGARRADAATLRRGEAEATPAETRAPHTGRFYIVAFEMKLKLSSLRGSRPRHYQEANEALLRAMESDPDFARAMQELKIKLRRTPTGLAPRTSPAGWTWHHAQEPGVMQLVPRSQHDRGTIFQGVLHPKRGGGYSRWGK